MPYIITVKSLSVITLPLPHGPQGLSFCTSRVVRRQLHRLRSFRPAAAALEVHAIFGPHWDEARGPILPFTVSHVVDLFCKRDLYVGLHNRPERRVTGRAFSEV